MTHAFKDMLFLSMEILFSEHNGIDVERYTEYGVPNTEHAP